MNDSLSVLSIAATNIVTRATWGGRLYWAYTSVLQSIMKGHQGRNSSQEFKVGTEAESRRNTANWRTLVACSA